MMPTNLFGSPSAAFSHPLQIQIASLAMRGLCARSLHNFCPTLPFSNFNPNAILNANTLFFQDSGVPLRFCNFLGTGTRAEGSNPGTRTHADSRSNLPPARPFLKVDNPLPSPTYPTSPSQIFSRFRLSPQSRQGASKCAVGHIWWSQQCTFLRKVKAATCH